MPNNLPFDYTHIPERIFRVRVLSAAIVVVPNRASDNNTKQRQRQRTVHTSAYIDVNTYKQIYILCVHMYICIYFQMYGSVLVLTTQHSAISMSTKRIYINMYMHKQTYIQMFICMCLQLLLLSLHFSFSDSRPYRWFVGCVCLHKC